MAYSGVAAAPAAGHTRAGVPGYRLAYPPQWTARLWPDTLAGYGQLHLYGPRGRTLDLTLLPLRPHGPTLAALVAHDRAFLAGVTRSWVTLLLGPALRLSGRATPLNTGRASQILYIARPGIVYRLFFSHPADAPVPPALLVQVASTLRALAPTGAASHIPAAPPAPPSETCCHCPVWGTGWGTVLTQLDGFPVYWNAGNGDDVIGIRHSAYGSYTVAGWLHSPRNVSAAR